MKHNPTNRLMIDLPLGLILTIPLYLCFFFFSDPLMRQIECVAASCLVAGIIFVLWFITVLFALFYWFLSLYTSTRSQRAEILERQVNNKTVLAVILPSLELKLKAELLCFHILAFVIILVGLFLTYLTPLLMLGYGFSKMDYLVGWGASLCVTLALGIWAQRHGLTSYRHELSIWKVTKGEAILMDDTGLRIASPILEGGVRGQILKRNEGSLFLPWETVNNVAITSGVRTTRGVVSPYIRIESSLFEDKICIDRVYLNDIEQRVVDFMSRKIKKPIESI